MNPGDKVYDLALRTEIFAKDIRRFVKNIERNFLNTEDLRQLPRSSGSVGANYLEAEESIGDKDFLFRIKVCRKESKESAYWLRLIEENIGESHSQERIRLHNEAIELTKIFGAIVNKRK